MQFNNLPIWLIILVCPKSSVAIKNGSKEGKTEFAKSSSPFCTASILSFEKITRSMVNTQKSSGIKLFLNFKYIFLVNVTISPVTIYLKEITIMQALKK